MVRVAKFRDLVTQGSYFLSLNLDFQFHPTALALSVLLRTHEVSNASLLVAPNQIATTSDRNSSTLFETLKRR